jgi:hypothetical protein
MEDPYRYDYSKIEFSMFFFFLSQESLKMVYYSCFHLIMMYGIIFWETCIIVQIFLD